MKYCSNCGKEIKSKDIYCSNCGKKIEKEAKEVKNEEINNIKINKRDIATQIILTVITCGLYSLYWIATITVLSIIKADLISLILMQSDLNKFEN